MDQPRLYRANWLQPGRSPGRNPRELVRSGEHDAAFYKQMWDTILSGKVWRGELLNKRKDGSLYVEEEAITPVVDDDGNITHFIAIKQDITRRKQVEKEREQLQRQERLAAIGQLAAGIAHDFNNLMAVILLYSQLLGNSKHLTPKSRASWRQLASKPSERLALLSKFSILAAGLWWRNNRLICSFCSKKK